MANQDQIGLVERTGLERRLDKAVYDWTNNVSTSPSATMPLSRKAKFAKRRPFG